MTPEERARVTPDEFEAWIREVAEANPDRTNPAVRESCVYTDPTDPSRHCLIGEVLDQHDPEALPAVGTARNGRPASSLMIDLGYDEMVAWRANSWQKVADIRSVGDVSTTWGEVAGVRSGRRP